MTYCKYPRRISWYRWNDFKSNEEVFNETYSRRITCTNHERKLWLYEHVARLSEFSQRTILSGRGKGGAHKSHHWNTLGEKILEKGRVCMETFLVRVAPSFGKLSYTGPDGLPALAC